MAAAASSHLHAHSQELWQRAGGSAVRCQTARPAAAAQRIALVLAEPLGCALSGGYPYNASRNLHRHARQHGCGLKGNTWPRSLGALGLDALGLVLELVDELIDAADHDARLALGRLLYAHGGEVLGEGHPQVLGLHLVDLLLLGLHDVGQRRVPGWGQ
eukprot:scaffold112152_cov63-Phaeocystis_antarctica.AAC.1